MRPLPGQLPLLPEFAAVPRILCTVVPGLFPLHDGPVHTLISGEAPGPLGADKSGVPFTGDAAGEPLFRALLLAGCARFPGGVTSLDDVEWDGVALKAAGFLPEVIGVAVTNAFPSCPTDDGEKFRAPKRNATELRSPANLERLAREVAEARRRGLRQVLTMGKVARWVFESVLELPAQGIPVIVLPHPSAQGLLQMAPDRGKGARMADLRQEWITRVVAALTPFAASTEAAAGSPRLPPGG
jgi:uracil-DNA glycosylase